MKERNKSFKLASAKYFKYLFGTELKGSSAVGSADLFGGEHANATGAAGSIDVEALK